METSQHIRSFVASAREYLRVKTESSHNAVQRHLLFISAADDIAVFDPRNSGVVEFFVTLHELMHELESRSSMIWHAINVLHSVCRNSSARRELIHTYKFTPVLTKVLGARLIHQQRVRVLQLLQELTYGIKISWREAYLTPLISILTESVTEDEKDIAMYSLGVLVNICYRNLPAIYTLMRCVDVKQFLQTIINLQNSSVGIKAHVCKLLIILQEASSEIPETDILNFVKVSFSTLRDAFRRKDVFLMRHVIEFFSDVRTNDRSKEIFMKHENHFEDVKQILTLIEESSDHECVGMAFEFLHSLVTLHIPELHSLYNEIATKAMPWIMAESARSRCLSLIHAIVIKRLNGNENPGMSFRDEDFTSQLENQLPVMAFVLNSIKQEELSLNYEIQEYLGTLFQLLKEMSKINDLKIKILAFIELDTVRKLFEPLCLVKLEGYDNLLHRNLAEFYVKALDFLERLAPHESEWLEFFSNLMRNKQVHVVLAAALLTGSESIKKQVLTLIGTVASSDECMGSLAKRLSELEPLLTIPTSGQIIPTREMGNGNDINAQETAPILSLSKENRLDAIIERLENAIKKKDIQDISISAIMELYEYKLAVMQHSEHALQTSLEAASNFSTHLKQKLAQVSAETSKLHQLLYQSHQKIEGLIEEKNAATQSLRNAENVAEKWHANYIQEMKSKQALMLEMASKSEELERTISLRDEERKTALINLETLKEQHNEKVTEIYNLKSSVKQLTDRDSEREKVVSKMEERLSRRERTIQEKSSEVIELTNKSKALSEEVNNLNLSVKSLEKELQDKEKQIETLENKNNELSHMIEVISKISTGRKLV